MNDEASFRSILDDLIDLFGWEDKTPLHAALHVRNAVLNLRADLAVAQQQRSRAHLDDMLARVEQGARAVERGKIIAWLRDGADIDLEPASLQIADAIECGDHLREWGQKWWAYTSSESWLSKTEKGEK